MDEEKAVQEVAQKLLESLSKQYKHDDYLKRKARRVKGDGGSLRAATEPQTVKRIVIPKSGLCSALIVLMQGQQDLFCIVRSRREAQWPHLWLEVTPIAIERLPQS